MSGSLKLRAMADERATAERLGAKGIKAAAARTKAKLFAQSADELLKLGIDPGADVLALFVPGRIEVLGRHTDYAGGRTVVVAADRGFCLLAANRTDARFRMIDVAWGEQTELAIDPRLTPTFGHWSNYPMTVARRLARNFPPPLRGADVAFASDLPAASGMSSSSALMVASFFVISSVNGLSDTDEYRNNIDSAESLAGYLATVENGQSFGSLAGDKGVGTFGGSEDHTAMLCCRPDTMSEYSYCPVCFRRHIPVPSGYVFAIGSSGVLAEKTGSAREKYNRASRLAAGVAEAWRKATGRDDPHIAAAVAAADGSAEKVTEVLRKSCDGEFTAAEMTARLEHFFAESEEIIPAAGDALTAGDVEEFGRLADRSQRNAEVLLGNQVPETIYLARSARELGAAAASSFGAGFGGSVWALVAEDEAAQMLESWAEGYKQAFPAPAAKANFFLAHAGPAAFELS